MSVARSKPLAPIREALVVDADGARRVLAEDVTASVVGRKAFGLLCLPDHWTPPFLVIPPTAFVSPCGTRAARIEASAIAAQVIRAAGTLGIEENEEVLVRSSGPEEDLDSRGQLSSNSGPLNKLPVLLTESRKTNLKRSKGREIAFVVQRKVSPLRAKGHLSNERHVSEEARDWVYEVESAQTSRIEDGKIPLRSWRRSPSLRFPPLSCTFDLELSDTLRIGAEWAMLFDQRMHLEWVWNGRHVYVVQADAEVAAPGVNPVTLAKGRKHPGVLKCHHFRSVEAEDGKRFSKIDNYKIYRDLRIDMPPLYILDDPEVIEGIAQDNTPNTLYDDLRQLTHGALVLRSDLDRRHHNDESRTLLKRSDGLVSVEAASRELIHMVKHLSENGIACSDIAILAHNYVPAVSAAWSYAAPNKRRVLIESLWGIPEGLYYYSHDDYDVDTRHVDVGRVELEDPERFEISRRLRYKGLFVAPDNQERWRIHAVDPKFQWISSIQRDEWVRFIAKYSRLIADKAGSSLSIMWFVGIPETCELPPVIPWYHAKADQPPRGQQTSGRRKLATDRTEEIGSREDIVRIRALSPAQLTLIRRLTVRPRNSEMLRDKDIANDIGLLAKELGATIELDGGVLSHIYYVLRATGAHVDVTYRHREAERREFGKLVRDKVPVQIQEGGEQVRVHRLEGEDLLVALRHKLVEEAIEALDAPDRSALVEELADVLEVVDGLCGRLRLSREQLEDAQRHKRARRGGFGDGIVLEETRNEGLPSDDDSSVAGFPDLFVPAPPQLKSAALSLRLDDVQRSIDRRRIGDQDLSMVTLYAQLLAASWKAESGDIEIPTASSEARVRASIAAKREGSMLRLEIVFFSRPIQMTLPLDSSGNAEGGAAGSRHTAKRRRGTRR